MDKRERNITKLVMGTLFYGVLINFAILVFADSGSKEEGFPHDPYIFLLLGSLMLGFIVSYLLSKLKIR